MEMHQLRYFVEVVRRGNFTRAAEACHVTQPTLSHQIHKLEDELGEPLLERRRGGAVATELGGRFFPRAVRILEEADLASREAAEHRDAVSGTVRLGVIPTIAPYVLPGLLVRAKARHPGIRFDALEAPTVDLLRKLRFGEMDAAILSPPVGGSDLLVMDLFDDEFLLACPRDHALASTDEIGIEQVAGEAFVMLSDAHCLRGQAMNFCQSAGFDPEVVLESAQLDTVVAMVEAGLGISFVPGIAKGAFAHREVELREFAEDRPRRTISVVWPRRAAETRVLRAFVELCRETRSSTGDADHVG